MIVAAFTIQLGGGTLLTPNTRRKLHWAEQARITKSQRELARLVAHAVKLAGPTGFGRTADLPRDIHLTLVRGKGQRLLDLDALGAACKPYLDGIVDAGLLVDDSPKWCTPHYAQERGVRAELRVRITQPSEGA
jgi:hypothetical protein